MSGQKPIAREVIGPGGEATAAVLLNGHDVSINSPLRIYVCTHALLPLSAFVRGKPPFAVSSSYYGDIFSQTSDCCCNIVQCSTTNGEK